MLAYLPHLCVLVLAIETHPRFVLSLSLLFIIHTAVFPSSSVYLLGTLFVSGPAGQQNNADINVQV